MNRNILEMRQKREAYALNNKATIDRAHIKDEIVRHSGFVYSYFLLHSYLSSFHRNLSLRRTVASSPSPSRPRQRTDITSRSMTQT